MPKRRDLKLNSISRYSKVSPSLILEEHSHCEVPAGCGGVVLRWLNPNQAIPVQLWLHTSGEAEFFIDGSPPSSSRPLLNYGDHVIALRISGYDSKHGVLMFAAFYDEEESTHVSQSRRVGDKIYILSDPDGSWKYTLAEPDDDSWMYAEFDDAGWLTMSANEIPAPAEQDMGQYEYRRLERAGAKGLGVEGRGEVVWVRKQFQLVKGT
jgi:hypothetical protein